MTNEEVQAGFKAARKLIDDSGYGTWVKDSAVKELVKAVLEAAEEA